MMTQKDWAKFAMTVGKADPVNLGMLMSAAKPFIPEGEIDTFASL